MVFVLTYFTKMKGYVTLTIDEIPAVTMDYSFHHLFSAVTDQDLCFNI
jgi:hypothetical protein